MELNTDETNVREASEILRDASAGGYEEALTALGYNVGVGWEEALLEDESGDDGRLRRDGGGLLRFLRNHAFNWIRPQRREIEGEAQVRSQALGEAVDLEQLDKVARYETHLDRKLGRSPLDAAQPSGGQAHYLLAGGMSFVSEKLGGGGDRRLASGVWFEGSFVGCAGPHPSRSPKR